MPTSCLPLCFAVPERSRGLRLDAALALALPHLGLRARRRLWDWCRVSVNDRSGSPGRFVQPGDVVRVEPLSSPPTEPDAPVCQHGGAEDLPDLFPPEARAGMVLACNADYLALYKPEGLHTAHISGSPAPSLEKILAAARPWQEAVLAALHPVEAEAVGPAEASGEKGLAALSVEAEARPLSEFPRLLTRLDAATSGIVLAARHGEALRRFRLAERRGMVRKTYLAVVQGRLENPLLLTARLDMAGQRRTRLLDQEDPDPARHTRVRPMAAVSFPGPARCSSGADGSSPSPEPARPEPAQPEPAGDLTLVQVNIARGARHQIRAHLAGAGFPLLGERLYPAPASPAGFRLYLHHAHVQLPDGFTAFCMPAWEFTELRMKK